MDRGAVAGIVASDMTVSDKIRALAADGCPRADIARALGKRYQHVRNVLEADKLSLRAPPAPGLDKQPAEGLEEASTAYESVHRLKVEADGVVRLPPDALAALQARPGSVVIAEVQPDGLKLFSNSAAWDCVRVKARELGIDPSRDLVAELIAERRAEAARDD